MNIDKIKKNPIRYIAFSIGIYLLSRLLFSGYNQNNVEETVIDYELNALNFIEEHRGNNIDIVFDDFDKLDKETKNILLEKNDIKDSNLIGLPVSLIGNLERKTKDYLIFSSIKYQDYLVVPNQTFEDYDVGKEYQIRGVIYYHESIGGYFILAYTIVET